LTTTYSGFQLDLLEGAIARILFNRPKQLNGMTQGMKRDLVEALNQIQMNDEVRVVMFTGGGSAFSAGDDISSTDSWAQGEPTLVPALPPGHHDALSTYNALRVMSQALILAVYNLDKPTIAAINGYAIQSGFSLAMACDFRIASTTAKLGSGTLRYGMLPDEGGHWLVVRALGVARALDFLLRARIVEADEAMRLGLVNMVVSPDELEGEAMSLAGELITKPQTAMRALKRAIYRAADLTFEQACDDIATRSAFSDYHPDADEGGRAFREKRAPNFARPSTRGLPDNTTAYAALDLRRRNDE
jgi:2-(1,2-epoxy-1,2-dihydrophenyl)acetyl-CoA isomerase